MTSATRNRRTPEQPELSASLLGVAYLSLAALYAWQASRRVSPTIFSDEIEFTQISRGIAENGVPSRRGEPSGFDSLYTYLVAPAWWLDDPRPAWEAAKLIGVLTMTAAIFPAYALARFVVSRPWALAAAIVAVAAPPLAYAPYLLEEPLAYPISTAALWADRGRASRSRRVRRLALAAALCLVAPLVRGELAVLLAVFGAGLFVLLWRDRALHALAGDAGRPGTGWARRCSSSARRRLQRRGRAPLRRRGTSRRASSSTACWITASGRWPR